MDTKIKMISAASRVLTYSKNNPMAIDEEVFQDVTDYISQEKIRDEKTKQAMIASASRAYELFRKNPKMHEKEILRLIMEETPSILSQIEEEY